MSNTLSISETDVFTALRSVFLRTYGMTAGPSGLAVVRGQVNRVPEPKESDFIVMWPISRSRMGTNVDTYIDAKFIGQIRDNVLFVSDIMSGAVSIGNPIFFINGVSCTVLSQSSGDIGGVGSYCVSTVIDMPLQIVYGGMHQILQSTDLVIQCDVHGPHSADNAQRMSTLWFDDYTVMGFNDLGVEIAPLFADDPKQIPFVNGESQYEDRWVVDLHMEINPVVTVVQQFADKLHITPVDIT